jgi:hypothetical protein
MSTSKQFNELQLEEIYRHKWIESEKKGYDIGDTEAALDWIKNHAAKFRKEYEAKKSQK